MSDTTLSSGGGARILDRRYQRYTGPRKGQAHATRRLAVHAFQRLLGLRRPFRFKIVPILLAIVCYLPVLGYIAIAAILPIDSTLLSYRQVFAILGTPVLLFVVAVGPGGMIADRNSKSLSLYLASPLTRTTYLLAQAAALLAALSVVTLGPPLLYLIGNIVQGIGPDGLGGVLEVAGKIVLGGALIAAYYTALTMAVGAISNRAGVAGGVLFLVLSVLSGAVGAAIFNGASPFLILIDFGSVPGELVNRIFGPEGFAQEIDLTEVPAYLVALVTAGWAGLAGGITWYRYRRLLVSR